MGDEAIKYLKALVFLQLQQVTGAAFDKPELLLSQAGFSAKEVGEMLGKSEGAASKAISRAKKATQEADK